MLRLLEHVSVTDRTQFVKRAQTVLPRANNRYENWEIQVASQEGIAAWSRSI